MCSLYSNVTTAASFICHDEIPTIIHRMDHSVGVEFYPLVAGYIKAIGNARADPVVIGMKDDRTHVRNM